MRRKNERPRWTSFTTLASVESFLLSPDGTEVLLLKRGAYKKVLPNHYGGVGGKMDSRTAESPLEAAERETAEESGYAPGEMKKPLGFKAVFTVFDKFGRWTVFEFAGTVKKKKFARTRRISEGTLEWVKLADLKKKNLIQDLRNGLLEKILTTKKTLFVTVTYGADDRIVSLKQRSD
jgi:8-oxo-dGTP pyrophosphatase MutT (NUDIX family)